MTYLTRDEFLSNKDVLTEAVDVPSLGGVLVRGMNVSELIEFMAVSKRRTIEHEREERDYQVTIKEMVVCVRSCTLDGNGNQLFTVEDDAALMHKPLGTLRKVARVVLRLSGLTAESQDDITKN
jgi:hypothetical protein